MIFKTLNLKCSSGDSLVQFNAFYIQIFLNRVEKAKYIIHK